MVKMTEKDAPKEKCAENIAELPAVPVMEGTDSAIDKADWEILHMSGPWLGGYEAQQAHPPSTDSIPIKFESKQAYRDAFRPFLLKELQVILSQAWAVVAAQHAKYVEQGYTVPPVHIAKGERAKPGKPAQPTSGGRSEDHRAQSEQDNHGDGEGAGEEEEEEGQLRPSFWRTRFYYPDRPAFGTLIGSRDGDGEADFEMGDLVLLSDRELSWHHRTLAIVERQVHVDTEGGANLMTSDFKMLKGRNSCIPREGILAVKLGSIVALRRTCAAFCNLAVLPPPIINVLVDPTHPMQRVPARESQPKARRRQVEAMVRSVHLEEWFKLQTDLNEDQEFAVACAITFTFGFFLIQGPPGTGKTATIVAMVGALFAINNRRDKRLKVLLCGPSNAALDEIVTRVQAQVMSLYSYDDPMGRYGCLQRVGPKGAIDSRISLDNVCPSGKRHAEALLGADFVCCTLAGAGMSSFDEIKQQFDIVIIDEAAQAVELEALIAIQRARKPGKIILVGDPMQLPATVFQTPSGPYERSLFERLQLGGLPVHMLRRQYRMRPEIRAFPSAQFYDNQLEDSATIAPLPFSAKVLGGPPPSFGGYSPQVGPYRFFDVAHGRDTGGGKASRSNRAEATAVLAALLSVKKLLGHRKLSFGVITPYSAQRRLLNRELHKHGHGYVEVNTVDGFQGREMDVIILSCVRACARGGIGFVADIRRLNVALTRARHCLLVVGCAQVLERASTVWHTLIADARARGCYQLLVKEPPGALESPERAGNVGDANGRPAAGAPQSKKKRNRQQQQQQQQQEQQKDNSKEVEESSGNDDEPGGAHARVKERREKKGT